MKLREYIDQLQVLLEAHGDLEVQTSFDFNRRVAPPPAVAYALLLKGRETKSRFWAPYYGDERKGDKVVQV